MTQSVQAIAADMDDRLAARPLIVQTVLNHSRPRQAEGLHGMALTILDDLRLEVGLRDDQHLRPLCALQGSADL